MVLAIGQRLGHYEIQAPIGSGGMGAVYRAHDTLLRRTVAIKVLHSDLAGDARARLLREARAASALSHPRICTVHSVEEADGFTFIVMEHVAGEPLHQVGARLTGDQISRYGIQIARALEHAHEHHVVHRDLKSSNIMITPEGDAIVLDFGIAAQLVDEGHNGGRSTIADTADLAGTVAYMAPERLRGERGDERSDIWSLGVVLYEMATRSSPFKGETAYALSAAILDEAPAPLPSSTSATLKHVIERCLEKNRAHRYHTAGEVAAGLELSESSFSSTSSLSVRKWAAAIGGLVLAAALTFVALNRRGPAPSNPVTPPIQSVAILPLRVIGGTSDEAHLGVGIADAIITRLAGVRHIALRPTAAVLSYATGSPDPARVATALNVDQVIFGTIQPTPAAYRVSLQVVRAADSSIAWGRTLDVSRDDLLALQDTVAEQIVTALSLQLTSGQRERLNRRYTENMAAYTLYVRGRALLLNYTEANMRQAVDSFERALAIDPSYTLARAGLATACAWFSTRYAYGTDATTWGERAEREARAALADDESLAEAHLAIASAAGTLYRGFDWKALLEETERALELDPGMELAYLARMRAFYHLGLFSRADEERRRARLLNTPFNSEIARLEVAVKLFAGEFAAARDLATALLPRTDAPVVRQVPRIGSLLSRRWAGRARDACLRASG